MFKFNKAEYLDKLHAGWVGKNIGGTMGAPYEACTDFLDIDGYLDDFAEPLPNDDLDLQLIWLCAMENTTPYLFNANTLADYWVDWIPPHFNEYGICKTNLRMGLLPPMCGELDNDRWKTSNGAWIRSEIWAALAPGMPDLAIKYAVWDAAYDHGTSEGVYAEMFTAALQSLAYVESNVRTLIDKALEKIPSDSQVAQTIRLVIDCFEKGVDYKETRERIIEFNRNLGWFQAPANIGFVIIGLLWGNGDYRKSLVYAINCGDDTDCTGATVGATLGIIGGMNGIPNDLKENISDKIVTLTINGMYTLKRIPKTCSELTSRVFKLVPDVMKANGIEFEFVDDETKYVEGNVKIDIKKDRKPYSFEITNYQPFGIEVEMDKTPKVREGDERNVKITFICNPKLPVTYRLHIRLILPQTWLCNEYDHSIQLMYPEPLHEREGKTTTEFNVTVGEEINDINRVYVEVTSSSLAYPVIIPITFIG